MSTANFHTQVELQLARLSAEVDEATVSDRRVDEATVSEVLNLEVAYCGLLLRWALCCFQTGADLIPVNVELAPPEDVYDVFALTSMPAVQAWGPSNPVGLCEIVAEIRGTLSAHHRQKIEAHPNRGVAFNFDAIKHRDGLECCVRQRRRMPSAASIAGPGVSTDCAEVVLDFPLFEPTAELDPRLLKIRISMRVPTPAEGSRSAAGADVKWVLPRHLNMRLTSSYRPNPWNLDDSLWDYLPSVQEYIRNAWTKRKELAEALATTYSVLEYDAMDYSAVHLMAKQKVGKQAVVRLVEFTFTLDFPEKPPLMTIHEFPGSRSWKLDPVLYRYSPRWTVHRMGEELFTHALTHSQVPWTAS